MIRVGSSTMSGVGPVGGEHERRPVAPAPDDLGREHVGTAGVVAALLLHVGAEGRDVGLELAVDLERAVAVKRRGRGVGQTAVLVDVAVQELACADVAPAAGAVGLAVARACLHAAPGDRRLRDPVEEAEVVLAAGQRLRARLVDHRRRAVRLAELAQHLPALVEVLVVDRVDRDEHVGVAGAQAACAQRPHEPVLGGALAAVAEALGARGHALAELGGEGGEDVVGDAERLQAGVGEGGVGGRRRWPVLPGLGGRHLGQRGAHQRAGPVDVLDVQEDVGGRGEGVAAQDVALDVGTVDVGGLGAAPGQVARPLERQVDDRLAAGRHQRPAFAKVLRKRSCSAAASSPCASAAKSTSW